LQEERIPGFIIAEVVTRNSNFETST